MSKLIIMCFDENDADFLYVIEDNETEEYANELVALWEKVKKEAGRNRLSRVYDDKYEIDYFLGYSDNNEIRLNERETKLLDDILPNPNHDCGARLEDITVYEYSKKNNYTFT